MGTEDRNEAKGQARIIELLEENNRLTEKLFVRLKALDRKMEVAVRVGGGIIPVGHEVEDALTRINRWMKAQERAAEPQNPSAE